MSGTFSGVAGHDGGAEKVSGTFSGADVHDGELFLAGNEPKIDRKSGSRWAFEEQSWLVGPKDWLGFEG